MSIPAPPPETDPPASPPQEGPAAEIERLRREVAALREREQHLTRLAAQVPGVLYQYRVWPDGRSCFPFASEGIRDVYRVTPEQVRDDASALFAIGHPDDVERVVASIAASQRDLTPWDCEYRVRFADGTVQWLHGRATPERLPDGSTLWHGVITRIDARKRAEYALREREASLRQAQRLARLGSWRWSRDSARLEWSDETFRIFGLDPDAGPPAESDFLRLIHPDDRERLQRVHDEAMAARRPYEAEFRIVTPAGVVKHLLGRAEPVLDDDGRFVAAVGTVLDITEHREAELALHRSEQAFRQFFDTGLVGMTIEAPYQGWERVNRRMAEMLGYTPEEYAQHHWTDLTHPDDVDADMAQYERLLRGDIDDYTLDKRYLRKDGSVMDASLVVRAERDEQGRAVRVFAIVVDVTARREAERALERHRDELEKLVEARTHELVAARDAAQQASRAKTEFLSSMSHELRTPLNAILGFAQLLELDRTLTLRSRGYVTEVLRAGRHLLRLINEVLDLAHVESGRLALSPEPLVLADLVQEALTLTEPLARQRDVALRAEVPGDLVVRADRLRLKQVLLNLVSNAVKYNRQRGSASIVAHPLDEFRLRVEVRDTGAGIAPERLPQLFQPFSRLGAEFGPVEGTGIGLSLSKRLVELMAGRIGVDSEPGRGSTFWIELPRDRLADPPPPRPVADAAAPAPLPAHELGVLCVEDNPANLALVEQILARHAGVRVIGAPSARLGLELARAHRPALVLLDIHLPEMDGYEALARLRADPATATIPVVALTAHAMPADARRAIEAGFDEYLTKPIDVSVFDAVVGRLLARAGRA
jgi:PAS domain S-box-containing protein